jgi:hypothetical protein
MIIATRRSGAGASTAAQVVRCKKSLQLPHCGQLDARIVCTRGAAFKIGTRDGLPIRSVKFQLFQFAKLFNVLFV